MTGPVALLIVCLFGLALVIGDLALGRVLDTDAHRDARRRHAHPLAEERWWK